MYVLYTQSVIQYTSSKQEQQPDQYAPLSIAISQNKPSYMNTNINNLGWKYELHANFLG